MQISNNHGDGEQEWGSYTKSHVLKAQPPEAMGSSELRASGGSWWMEELYLTPLQNNPVISPGGDGSLRTGGCS